MRAQLLDGATETHRHNVTEIYYVVDGSGATQVAGETLEWSDRDIFVVPPNDSHDADGGATLLAITDRPLLEGINFYHETADE